MSGVSAQALYDTLSSKINYTASKFLIENADTYTGTALSRQYIDSSLTENRQYASNVSDGISLIQTTSDQASRISDKLDRMESLAEMASSGSYSADEVTAFQTEYEELASEISDIAIGTHPQGRSTLFYDGSEKIEVADGMEVSVNTENLTSSGLGITENMDLENDPSAALSAVQAARTTVDNHQAHLKDTAATLESAANVLSAQRENLQQISPSVQPQVAAYEALAAVMGSFSSDSSLMIATQANADANRAMTLLIE
jgi:flagellin